MKPFPNTIRFAFVEKAPCLQSSINLSQCLHMTHNSVLVCLYCILAAVRTQYTITAARTVKWKIEDLGTDIKCKSYALGMVLVKCAFLWLQYCPVLHLGFMDQIMCFWGFRSWPTYIPFLLWSLSRCSVARKSPAEQVQAVLAHSLMAHTSAWLLLVHNSLKCTGDVVEGEQQLNPVATLPLCPMLVNSVQRPDWLGVRRGSVGSHTQSPTRNVCTAKVVVKTVAMEHSNTDVILTHVWRMAPKKCLTNLSLKGTVLLYKVTIYSTFLYFCPLYQDVQLSKLSAYIYTKDQHWECHWLRGQGSHDNASAGSRGLGREEAPAAAAEDAVGGREREAPGTTGWARGEAHQTESAATPVASRL